MSMRPKADIVPATNATRSSLDEMLAGRARARPAPWAVLMASAAASQAGPLREEITTLAPWVASASAIARPIPREDPVAIATLPRKLKSGMSQARSYAVGRFDPALTSKQVAEWLRS